MLNKSNKHLTSFRERVRNSIYLDWRTMVLQFEIQCRDKMMLLLIWERLAEIMIYKAIHTLWLKNGWRWMFGIKCSNRQRRSRYYNAIICLWFALGRHFHVLIASPKRKYKISYLSMSPNHTERDTWCLHMNNEKTCNYITSAPKDTPCTCV